MNWNILKSTNLTHSVFFFLFLILFWCSFQSFRTPWLSKFSFYFRKFVSACSSPFLSFSVNCGKRIDCFREALAHHKMCTFMPQTSKQNKADPCVISAFSTCNMFIVYSVQISGIDILLHFSTNYNTDFPIEACIHLRSPSFDLYPYIQQMQKRMLWQSVKTLVIVTLHYPFRSSGTDPGWHCLLLPVRILWNVSAGSWGVE